MKKGLVLFGIGKIAEVIYYYASKECGFEVAAFCVDRQFIASDTFQGLPVVAFEDVMTAYPPDRFDMFVAVGYHDLNRLRANKCKEAMEKGYRLVSVVSPDIPRNVEYGWNCFVMRPSVIHPCVRLGNDVFVWSGAMVGHHSVLADHCWLTSCCNVSGNVKIGTHVFLAVNATVGHSATIGDRCFLGANTLVTKGLQDDQVVIAESSKPIRLNSQQFLRMSNFSAL